MTNRQFDLGSQWRHKETGEECRIQGKPIDRTLVEIDRPGKQFGECLDLWNCDIFIREWEPITEDSVDESEEPEEAQGDTLEVS